MRKLPRAIVALLVVMAIQVTALMALESVHVPPVQSDVSFRLLNENVTTDTSIISFGLQSFSENSHSFTKIYSQMMDGSNEKIVLSASRASSPRVSLTTSSVIGESIKVMVDLVDPGHGIFLSISTQPNTTLIFNVLQYSDKSVYLGSTSEQIPQMDLNCHRNLGFAVFPQDATENITYIVMVSGTPSTAFTLEVTPRDFRVALDGSGGSFIVEPCSPAYFMIPVTNLSDKTVLSVEAISDQGDAGELDFRMARHNPSALQHRSSDLIISSDFAEQPMDHYGQLRFSLSQMTNHGKGMYYGRIAFLGLGDAVSPLTTSRTVTVYPELHTSPSRLAFFEFVMSAGIIVLFTLACLYVVTAKTCDLWRKSMTEKGTLIGMVGFIFLLALIYTIPSFHYAMSMLTDYLKGRQDKCLFNFKCSRPWWKFLSLNDVTFNLILLLFGLTYVAIVFKQHDAKATSQPYYLLRYAIGLALFFQAIFSMLYHLCPNRVHQQFDSTFTLLIISLCLLVTWEHIYQQDSDMFDRLVSLVEELKKNTVRYGFDKSKLLVEVVPDLKSTPDNSPMTDVRFLSADTPSPPPAPVVLQVERKPSSSDMRLSLLRRKTVRLQSPFRLPAVAPQNENDVIRPRLGGNRPGLTLARFILFLLVLAFFSILILVHSYPPKPWVLTVLVIMILLSALFHYTVIRTEFRHLQEFTVKENEFDVMANAFETNPEFVNLPFEKTRQLLYPVHTMWWIRFHLGLGVLCSLGVACFLIYNYLTGVKMSLAFIIMSIVVVWQVVLYALVMVKGRHWGRVSDVQLDYRCCVCFQRAAVPIPPMGGAHNEEQHGANPESPDDITYGCLVSSSDSDDGGGGQAVPVKNDVTVDQSETLGCCTTTYTWYVILILLSLVFFGVALTLFFKMQATSIGTSPALSRDFNQDCVFGIWDMHDVWHLLVSFALMTCLCGQLIMPSYNNHPRRARDAKAAAAK